MNSDLDDFYKKIDRFDKTKIIRVDHFSLRGSLEGVITRIVFWIQNLRTSNITSALEMRPDSYCPNIKVSPFDDTELSYYEHFSI